MTHSVFLVAAERSGDDLGAGLIKELRNHSTSIQIEGIGGSAMRAQNVASDFDISPLSILGFTEAIKSYPVVIKKVREAVNLIMKSNPDAVILIDSWGFMLRVAWGLRKAGYKGQLIKYVAPQVWAMREGRAKVLANAVDHLLTIHSFDAPYFDKHGLPVHYVGNPVFDTDHMTGDKSNLYKLLKIQEPQRVVTLLFGSRPKEIDRLIEPISEAVSILKRAHPGLVFVSPVSSSVEGQLKQLALSYPSLSDVHFVEETHKLDCFAAANAAIACSGTVTTQLADAGVPTVVTYKLSATTFFFARMLYKKDYISIVNIAADEALMPEFIQGDCRGEVLANAIVPYLEHEDLRVNTSEKLRSQTQKMRGEGGRASARAAKAVLEILRPNG